MTSPLFSQTATFISRGSLEGEDDMGEPIYSPEVGIDVPAWYEPVESVEDNRAAQQVITGYNLYVPNWVRDEFGAADKVLLDFDPTEYEVDPAQHTGPEPDRGHDAVGEDRSPRHDVAQ